MSKGALIFAHNNHEIDYGKIAALNAVMIRHNLNVDVSLVTDSGTLSWMKQSLDLDVDALFDKIILDSKDSQPENIRLYRDTSYSTKELPFYNSNHWKAYDLSPYDETLFVDADYLVMSDQLNKVWGCSHDVLINRSVIETLATRTQAPGRVSDIGIDLYWATVVYFKKSAYAELLFSLVHHIFENFDYYRQLYMIGDSMFRNDYAFSIAVHTLNGFATVVRQPELPIAGLLKAFDTDDFYSVNGKNDVTMLTEKPGYIGEYILTRVHNMDLHIMNKWSIIRNFESLLKVYL